MYKDTGTHIKFMQFVKKKISLVFTQSLFVHILDTFKVSMNILLSKPKQTRSNNFKRWIIGVIGLNTYTYMNKENLEVITAKSGNFTQQV